MCVCEQHLPLNNLQGLIWPKIKPNSQCEKMISEKTFQGRLFLNWEKNQSISWTPQLHENHYYSQ